MIAAVLVAMVLTACSPSGRRAATGTSVPGTASATQPSPRTPSTPLQPSRPAPRASAPLHSTMATVQPRPSPSRTPAAVTALPLIEPTGDATEVITVVATSTQSTSGTLQAWTRQGGGWIPFGGRVLAWLGSDGLTTHASESSTATPIGSFTLTQAFGREPDPGAALPYRQTTPADWWISQPGPLYNTFQHCVGPCPFAQGAPNEHLYPTVPFYRYAVVIDYNTTNAPGGVRQGAGSAFFLHVTVGEPTQGCVSIPEPTLTALMRWLTPAAHPRILIGVG